MKDYKFKTEPYAHQLRAFDICKDKDIFALFLEQGTGKTKIALDKACYQYCNGKINAVLIVAPNGVHSNWIKNEIPKHVPEYVQFLSIVWSKTKTFRNSFEYILHDTNAKDKFIFFAINIDALSTDEGKKYVRRFLNIKNVLMILDESSRIKTPNALRTKAAINFGKIAKERLIMTGTPITQSPFDLYAQFKFLDNEILGNQTYIAFKHEYGIFERRMNFKTGYPFDQLEQYQNLDKLQKLIEPYSYRITKAECLDLPEKIYQRYSIELSPTQRGHYNNLKHHLFTEIAGHEIMTPIVLTQLLRLQQITGGFLSLIDEGKIIPIGENNPKLNFMMDLISDIHTKIIIWARFVPEIKIIAKTLREIYGYNSTVEYWGAVNNDDRLLAVKNFQEESTCRFFVGNARAGGLGLTLTAAQTMIYFSNDFSLETRLQSEDRAHRIGQKDHVTYIDIEANDTLDAKIITTLREKKSIADLITGDTIKEWI